MRAMIVLNCRLENGHDDDDGAKPQSMMPPSLCSVVLSGEMLAGRGARAAEPLRRRQPLLRL